MNRFWILVILLCLSLCVNAADKETQQKAPKVTPVRVLLKDARTSIKNKRDQKNREKALLDALRREDIGRGDSADIYFMATQLEYSINNQENVKAYLKQKYDTAGYYNTLLQASRYAVLCDSIDRIPNEEGRVKPRYQNKNREMLLLCYPNLYLGGRFYLRKADYAKAYDYMSLYTTLSRHELIRENARVKGDTLLGNSTYYAMLSAYKTQQPVKALHYVDDAIFYADSARKAILQEYKVRCLFATNREDEGMRELRLGLRKYPQHDYFFTTMALDYEEEKQYDRCIALADSMLQHVQDIPIYWYSKSLMCMHKGDWAHCVEYADSVLSRVPDHIDALYNKGVSYLNMASAFASKASNNIHSPKYQQDRAYLLDLYSRAKEPCEALRRLRPDAVASWAPLLYRIYLNLNMGEEFKGIEEVLRQNSR